MAKGQQKSNREVKKPKKSATEKAKPGAAAASLVLKGSTEPSKKS